jgi:hypothetical protein
MLIVMQFMIHIPPFKRRLCIRIMFVPVQRYTDI